MLWPWLIGMAAGHYTTSTCWGAIRISRTHNRDGCGAGRGAAGARALSEFLDAMYVTQVLMYFLLYVPDERIIYIYVFI